MFRFMNQSLFLNLLLVLFLVVVYWFENRRLSGKIKKTFDFKTLPFFTAQFSRAKKNFKFFLSVFTLIFIIMAMARPQMGKKKSYIKSEGIELMVAMDVSRSMLSRGCQTLTTGTRQKGSGSSAGSSGR